MYLSRSHLGTLLSLVLLAGLAACGPTSSDNAPGQESRASASGPASQSTGQGGKAFTPPMATEDRTGAASGRGTVSGADNAGQGDKLLSKPGGTPNVETDGRDKLPVPGIPESIVKGLNSPDAGERLRALNHWGEKGTKAPLDPVFEALEDEDDVVRAKATAIIEQEWAIEHERKKG